MQNSSLFTVLRGVRRRWLGVSAASALGWALAASVAALLVAAWMDLVWEFEAAWRAAAVAIAAFAALGIAIVLVARAMRQGRAPWLARLLDDKTASGGEIMTAHDLLAEPRDRSPLSAALSSLAVSRATQLAENVDVQAAVPWTPARRPWLAVLGLGLLIALAGLVLPRLVRTQFARFADPWGDHPPYSRVAFAVEPGNTEVIYGRGLEVRAALSGDAVEAVDLVLRDAAGGQQTLPMFPRGAEGWQAALADLREPVEYFVRAGRARSVRYQIGVITVPQIEDVYFVVTPPAYAGQAAYEGPLPREGLAGLAGSQVKVTVRSNRPLRDGALHLTAPTAQSVTLSPPAGAKDAERTVVGQFEIRASGHFEIAVTDTAGLPSADRFSGNIVLLEDQKPYVQIVQPPPVSIATPTAALPIEISAEDDYGVMRVALFRSLNQSRDLPQASQVLPPPPVRWRDVVMLDLGDYGLEPGDEIRLYARAEDNDPSGAKGDESPVATVKIIAQEEFEQLVRRQQGLETLRSRYQQAARRLEAMRDELARLQKKLTEGDPDQPPGEEEKDELARLKKKAEQDAAALEQAAKNPLPYDLDKYLTPNLEESARKLERLARQLDELQKMSPETQQALAEALRGLQSDLDDEHQRLADEAIAPLEHLEKAYRLMADQARFAQLARQQRELEQRMQSLRDVDPADDPTAPARMAEMEAEQRQIREDLAGLLDEIEEHLEQLPDEPDFEKLKESAGKFVDAVRDSKVSDTMQQAESHLADQQPTPGHEEARKAAETLESFMKDCQMHGQGQACLVFQPSLAAGLGDTIAQLLSDAGLSGSSPSSGGGYSAQRNSMENIGLYGQLPSLGGDGLGQRGPQSTARGTHHGGAGAEDGPADEHSGLSASSAGGAAESAVPERYRQRVRRYFQRIVDEAPR